MEWILSITVIAFLIVLVLGGLVALEAFFIVLLIHLGCSFVVGIIDRLFGVRTRKERIRYFSDKKQFIPHFRKFFKTEGRQAKKSVDNVPNGKYDVYGYFDDPGDPDLLYKKLIEMEEVDM